MGKAFDVSPNIGFDGASYYCRRCGKAGYGKATQVRGHLALCPGTLMRKGVEPTTSSNHLQPLASGYNGGLSGGQLLQPVEVDSPVANPLAGAYEQRLTTMENTVTTMQNHYTHVMQQNNPVQSESWFSKNLGWLVLGGIAFIALLSGMGQGCQCPVSGSSDKSPTPKANNGLATLGPKLFGKAAERAMTKAVDKAFA